MTSTQNPYERAAAAADFGRPSAAKRGRDSRWPYVPVIDYGPQRAGVHTVRTEQIKGKAFVTRDEAVAYAERHIEALRKTLANRLAQPDMRLLREQHGLPRDVRALDGES